MKTKSSNIHSFFFSEWNKELTQLIQQNLNRKLQLRSRLDFSSNDYLSLSRHPEIRNSLIKALKKNLPLSAGASRLIRGHTPWHEETELLFQQWAGGRPSLFFSSGYMANMGLIRTIGENSVLFSDQLNHASLIDASRFSKSPCRIYKHKDTNELENLLKKETQKKKIIITESLFSMDGDFAPLEELSEIALKHNALLIVDEAHATGIYGPEGIGLSGLLRKKEHIISVHPCGKALSGNGAFIAGPAVLKQYLINKCRNFIYTTAPSPILLFHIKCVLEILKKHPERRKSLKKKAKFFRDKIKTFVDIGDSESVIVPVITGSSSAALSMEKILQKKEYDIRAIRYPTVPRGKERLRICIHYNHTYKQLEQLAGLLKQLF